jgi:hypothetical protein
MNNFFLLLKKACPSKCDKCKSETECLSCLAIYNDATNRNLKNLCECKSGYFDDGN